MDRRRKSTPSRGKGSNYHRRFINFFIYLLVTDLSRPSKLKRIDEVFNPSAYLVYLVYRPTMAVDTNSMETVT